MTLIDDHFSEIIIYGGLCASRHEVYKMALEDTNDKKAADFFANNPKTITKNEANSLPHWKDHSELRRCHV
jgi:hypothetical protein